MSSFWLQTARQNWMEQAVQSSGVMCLQTYNKATVSTHPSWLCRLPYLRSYLSQLPSLPAYSALIWPSRLTGRSNPIIYLPIVTGLLILTGRTAFTVHSVARLKYVPVEQFCIQWVHFVYNGTYFWKCLKKGLFVVYLLQSNICWQVMFVF